MRAPLPGPTSLAFAAAILAAFEAGAQSERAAARRDQGVQAEEEDAADSHDHRAEPRLPWRGTALKWTQALTTQAVGVGQDFQSDAHHSYAHGYWALLNYYVLDERSARIRVASSPGFDVEYTNSDATTYYREPQFRDLNLTAVGLLPVWQDARGAYAFTLLPNATVLFPTSKVSRDTSTYLVTSPRLTAAIDGPLIEGETFPAIFQIAASVRWDHRFSAATEPVNPELERRSRQTPTGAPYFSDQISGSPFAHDTIQAGGLFYVEGLLGDGMMEFLTSLSWSNQYLYDFDDDVCVATLGGGCAEILGAGSEATTRVVTSFVVQLGYYPMPEWGFYLGYQNDANQLAPDGQRRSPFYSPNAAFTTQFVLSLDALYQAGTGRRRTTRFVLPG